MEEGQGLTSVSHVLQGEGFLPLGGGAQQGGR